MDFMTVDTLFGERFCLLIIMELKTRRIIRYDLTGNPCREFVKQRIELFSENFKEKKTLIYDNALQFTSIDYSWYSIIGVTICTSAPNMNAFVEYYNNQRMHQGINKIPDAEINDISGTIKKTQVLCGLHHHYYRSSA